MSDIKNKLIRKVLETYKGAKETVGAYKKATKTNLETNRMLKEHAKNLTEKEFENVKKKGIKVDVTKYLSRITKYDRMKAGQWKKMREEHKRIKEDFDKKNK